MANTSFLEIPEVRKGMWAFFLDCAFRMLIGSTVVYRSDCRYIQYTFLSLCQFYEKTDKTRKYSKYTKMAIDGLYWARKALILRKVL